METLGKRLRRLRSDRGYTQSMVAGTFGVTPNAVTLWETDKTKPAREKLIDLARMYRVSVEELIAGASSPEAVNLNRLLSGEARVASDAPPLPARQSMARDVPVFGRAQGGSDGAVVMTMGEAQDYVRRPPGLAGRSDVFALYQDGSSMSPWREDGGLIYVHNTQAPKPGNHVVVIVREAVPEQGQRAYVKKLVQRTSTKLKLWQYNPPLPLDFDVEDVVRVYLALEWDEVFGL